MKFAKEILVAVAVSAITTCAVAHFSGPFGGSLRSAEGKNVSTITSPAGQFLFTLRSREKADAGYKFGFSIGNHNFAKYEGLTIRVSWGKKPGKDEKPNFASQDVKIDSLAPGQWKDLDVVIQAASETDLQLVNLNIVNIEKVSLEK